MTEEDNQVDGQQKGIQMSDQQENSILVEDGAQMMDQLEDNIQVEDLQVDGVQLLEDNIQVEDLQEDGVRLMGQLEDNIQVEDLQEDEVQTAGHQNISDHGTEEVLCIVHRDHGNQYHLDASLPSLNTVGHNHQGEVLFCRLPFLMAFYKHMMVEGLQQLAGEAMGLAEAEKFLEIHKPPSHSEQVAPSHIEQ